MESTRPQTSFAVSSEIGRLESVIVHKPGLEVVMIHPEDAVDWLYEDIVDHETMYREHQTFTSVLSHLSVEVLDIQDLLADVLSIVECRQWLVSAVCALEAVGFSDRRQTLDMPDQELAELLVTGVLYNRGGCPNGHPPREFQKRFRPVPNIIFTRDMAAVVNDIAIVSQAAKPIRVRESHILRAIFRYHHRFASVREVLEPTGIHKQPITIEGGDIVVLSERHIAIGQSERTNKEAIRWLLANLFERGTITGAFIVHIPRDRRTMHLDTIFTIISQNEALAYAPLIQDTTNGNIKPARVTYCDQSGKRQSYRSLERALGEHGYPFTYIWCAQGMPIYEAREQWVDAVNSLAVAPGTIIVYQRNRFTLEALEHHGYRVVSAADCLADKTNYDPAGKLAITLETSELCRARGGPHCMSLPIRRAPL